MIADMPFTSEPKIRRHGNFISGDRCRIFMGHCWEKGLRKKVSYETLAYEFTVCFETNDKRTIVKYLGRPKTLKRYSASNTVRVNRISGNVAQFSYSNTRCISKRRGLLETLCFMTECGDGYYKLNHELLPYYTEQTTLSHENVNPLALSHQEVKECSEVFVDDLRVRCGKEAEEIVKAQESRVETSVGEKKEEEVIESTHANPYLYPNMTPEVCDRTAEANTVLTNNNRGTTVVRSDDSMESIKTGRV